MDAKTQNLLDAPLDPRRVMGRAGSGGKTLSYLQTHDVKRTANKIFGYDGWSYDVEEIVCLGEEPFKNRNGKEGIRVGYRATVSVQVHLGEKSCYRSDVGYGDAMEYNGSKITPHELASKEAVSDAIKRCLSSWGDQFGLVLYGADPAPEETPAPADRQEAAQSEPAKVSGSSDPAERPPPTPSPPGRSDDRINQWQIKRLKDLTAQLRAKDPLNEKLATLDAVEPAKLGRWSEKNAAEWILGLESQVAEVEELGAPLREEPDPIPS